MWGRKCSGVFASGHLVGIWMLPASGPSWGAQSCLPLGFQTSDLQPCVGINHCCLQPPGFGDCYSSHQRLIHHQQWRTKHLSPSLSFSVSKFFSTSILLLLWGQGEGWGKKTSSCVCHKCRSHLGSPSSSTPHGEIWRLSRVIGEIRGLCEAACLRTGLDMQHSLSALEPRGGGHVLQPADRLPCRCCHHPPLLTTPSVWLCPSSQMVGKCLKCPPGRDKYQRAGSWNLASYF